LYPRFSSAAAAVSSASFNSGNISGGNTDAGNGLFFLEEFQFKIKEYYEVLFFPTTKTTSAADLFVQFIGFALLYATIAALFLNMYSIGSKFVLGFTVLLCGTFALVVSLVLARLVGGISVNLILLLECIPFLVVTIGFERPFVFSKVPRFFLFLGHNRI
jgi:hypothetical protein